MKKWRSRVTTDGLDRAPHRAFMRAMGLDDAALAKPMIGVVSMKGEQTPCNMTHDFQVDAAKAGSPKPAARRANLRPFRSPTASA